MVVGSTAFATVRDFLVCQTGLKADSIAPESRLVEDLRIGGDDLVEFMEAFFDELHVEMGTYNHMDYASAEGFSLFGKKEIRKSLPVSALVAALERGSWDA